MTWPIMDWGAGNPLPAAQLNEYVRDPLTFLKKNILLETPVELTIVGGAVTATQTYHTVDTEGHILTDDLDSIGGVAEGRILILRAEDDARTVVLKHGANLILGADIHLDDTNKHVILIGDVAGNLHLLYSARDVTFMANAFQYPNPGTDWTPQLEGAHLAQSLANKKTWLPLNFLKAGDVIISYKLAGDAIMVAALTLDCKLVRVNLAHDPLGTTDIAGGATAQIDADGDFYEEAVLIAPDIPQIVTAQNQYVLEIKGTTGVGDSITVMGAEVIVRRLV